MNFVRAVCLEASQWFLNIFANHALTVDMCILHTEEMLFSHLFVQNDDYDDDVDDDDQYDDDDHQHHDHDDEPYIKETANISVD